LCGTADGGYGGASCVSNNFIKIGNDPPFTCQDELNCAQAPNAACCKTVEALDFPPASVCKDAGF
jgi:hypothetical protein